MISEKAEREIRSVVAPWLRKHLLDLLKKKPHIPFHQALFPGRDLSVWGEERSFSTALGNRFQRIALILARDIHGNGESNYTVTGTVPNATLSTIAAIVSDLRSGARSMNGHFPDFVQMVRSGYAGDLVQRSARVDLFYRDTEGGENYFEIKSPKPNRGQCWEATERLLLVHGLRASHTGPVHAYYGMPYNPYGEVKAAYAWHHAVELLDIANQVLTGQEFWDFIGGSGTYHALLGLFTDIGLEVAQSVRKAAPLR
ncbi:MAG: TdeIII family type II restriction endonuclease [Dehalococcoidia bacterium]